MSTGFVKVSDGTEIFYKDLGEGQPIVFHHGWPLSSDDWDAQMLFFLRTATASSRTTGADTAAPRRRRTGNEMDTYAADVAALVAHLDLRDAIHIGHSTGGGEVARYVARHGKGRVAKACSCRRRPPIMVKTPKNPGGLPIEVFDGFRSSRGQSDAVLHRPTERPVLRLQPPGREGLRGQSSATGGAKA
jgi:non-heme chloroperoxidase